MTRLILSATIFATLSACASTSPEGVNTMIRSGQLHVSAAPDRAAYRYVVTFPVLRDFGFSTERLADRRALVAAALPECHNPRIIRETAIQSGQIIDRSNYIYTEFVGC